MRQKKKNKYTGWDFGNQGATIHEMHYLCQFAYHKSLQLFLDSWTDWMDRNQARVELTIKEKEAWKDILTRVKTTHPLHLMRMGEEICRFWNSYQKQGASW